MHKSEGDSLDKLLPDDFLNNSHFKKRAGLFASFRLSNHEIRSAKRENSSNGLSVIRANILAIVNNGNDPR